MVDAQYRLATEGLGIQHVGGMNALIWGEKYPDFIDALVPMASQPSAMSSRNWMMRRLIVDSIRNDTAWNNGNYSVQPRAARIASVFYGTATAGGTLAYQKLAPTREAADKLLDERLAAPFTADANEVLYQWDSSRDYDPSPGVEGHQDSSARDQFGGRRAKPARNWDYGARTQAHKKCSLLPHSCERGHAWPSDNSICQILETAATRIPANSATWCVVVSRSR